MSFLEIEDRSTGERFVRVRGAMVIRHAANLAEEWKTARVGVDNLIVDLSGVSELDSSGVQLLVALKKESLASGTSFKLVQHSPAVLSVFALYGLAAFFGDRIRLKSGERDAYGFLYGLRRGNYGSIRSERRFS